MCFFKNLLIFLSLLAVCCCDDKKHHHGHHMYFHEFHYLIFLALKFKIILIIGSIWTFGLIMAKIFAAFKIAEYMKKHHYTEDHHEHVVYADPHGSWGHSAAGIYGKSYGPSDVSFDHPPSGGGSFSGDISADQIPAGYGSTGGGANVGDLAPGQDNVNYNGYGRSYDEISGFSKYFSRFSRVIQRFNITERVFNEMNIKSEDCKRKFVCEADFNARNSIILKYAFDLLGDQTYQKYRSNQLVPTVADCAKLNPKCHDKT